MTDPRYTKEAHDLLVAFSESIALATSADSVSEWTPVEKKMVDSARAFLAREELAQPPNERSNNG